MRNPRISRQGGMTLVEAAIALVMFSIVAVSLFGAFWQGLKLEHRNKVHTMAVYMAGSLMEEAYGLDWDELTLNFTGEKVVQSGGVDFSVICRAKKHEPEEMGLADISVTVNDPETKVQVMFEGVVYAP